MSTTADVRPVPPLMPRGTFAYIEDALRDLLEALDDAARDEPSAQAFCVDRRLMVEQLLDELRGAQEGQYPADDPLTRIWPVRRILAAPPGSMVFVEVADSMAIEPLMRALARVPLEDRRRVLVCFLAPPTRAVVRRHLLPALWTLVRWAWRGWRSGR